jgi:hypothetical protein
MPPGDGRSLRDHAGGGGLDAELEELINRMAKFGFSKTSIVLSSAIEKRVPLGHIEGKGNGKTTCRASLLLQGSYGVVRSRDSASDVR